ncbi:MAG: hypothetical protein IJ255_06370, partial [Bacteroidales bacterium]|nr:hypothetical protein [Bacteroidales bacterium]
MFVIENFSILSMDFSPFFCYDYSYFFPSLSRQRKEQTERKGDIIMQLKLSDRIMKPDFQGEFTASILAAAASPDIISFAGGLPNPVSFPIPEMEAATKKVLEE